ncbi:hypothetical protein ACHAXN_012541 [Cyclotella atomus]
MKMKYLLPASVLLSISTAHAGNLRQAKNLKEWGLFDPKAGKASGGVIPLDAKAGKSTRIITSCGLFWHRSLSSLNPNSCTNDDVLRPDDPSKLYSTVEECCKAEFGKVHGCNVYNVCRPTSKPSPAPTKRKSDCGVFWHRSLSPLNPNACTDDGNLPDDPSKLYSTVQECCIAEFGKVHGCNAFKASCDEPGTDETNPPTCPPTRTAPRTTSPTPSVPDSGEEGTARPTRTLSPTSLAPTPLAEPESRPPSTLLRKSLAERLNDFYESGNATQNRDELRGALEIAGIEFGELEDVIVSTIHGLDATATSVSQELNVNISTTYTEQLESLDQREMKCKCVNCAEDSLCGGLWKGIIGHYDEDATDQDVQIHVVVSHCKSAVDWLGEFTQGFRIQSLHIISKCGYPVVGAPHSSTIIELPNVGRCDHTYAWYISNLLSDLSPTDEAVVVFLKDDISYENMHQLGEWSELKHLSRLASSKQGFACGINSIDVSFSQNRFSLSAFHETATLSTFAMDSYQRNRKGYTLDSTEFKSQYETLGSWWKSLEIEPVGDLTPVCFGGVFAASLTNIRKKSQEFWHALEINLSRGNNIQEGHYAERSWALLMSTPPESFQVRALIEHSDGVYINMCSMHGALMQLPKLFLHIGAKATSTETLSTSLIAHMSDLNSDGYRVAVHGKYDSAEHGCPNIDRLASCMWSDQIKQSFPDYMREATVCPDELLPSLSHYMNKAVNDHKDMVILNPWLSRRGTANSLALYLDSVWEVHAVIYYRRYYEWITLVFEEWKSEVLEHAQNFDRMPFSSFRYIDFIREYNKRLFYGKDVMEDGYPIRSFGSQADTRHAEETIVHHFDPSSNSNVEDLTDLTDYTYFVAQEYSSNPRFRRHLTIVNSHDHQSIETDFFCSVLHDAHNACKAAAHEELAALEHASAEKNVFVQTHPNFPILTKHVVQDIVVAGVKSGRLHADPNLHSDDVPLQLDLWIQQVRNAFNQSGTLAADLPLECLYNFEVGRLLEVSLAYELSLLPKFYNSTAGAPNLVQDFNNWQFCSVDTDKVLNDANLRTKDARKTR